jgi:hypothetical protein
MALKKYSTTIFGVNVTDAYHRVEGLQFINKTKMQFQVRASLDGVKPHFLDIVYECAYDIQGDNPFKQAYNHLKTLPEFENATDC